MYFDAFVCWYTSDEFFVKTVELISDKSCCTPPSGLPHAYFQSRLFGTFPAAHLARLGIWQFGAKPPPTLLSSLVSRYHTAADG